MRLKIFLLFVLVAGLAGVSLAGEKKSALQEIKKKNNYKILAGALADKKDPLSGKLVIEMRPIGVWKMNEKAPVILDIKAPDNFTPKEVKLRRKDLKEKKPEVYSFEVPYKAPAKGKYDLNLKFNIVICNKALCQMKRFKLTYSLNAG